FEMLTGEPPFAGRTLEAIVAKRLENPTPSARALRDTVPPQVDAAIRKAMARMPDDRFGTVTEFAQALAGAGREPGQAGLTSVPAEPAAPGLSASFPVSPTSRPSPLPDVLPPTGRPGGSRIPRIAATVA